MAKLFVFLFSVGVSFGTRCINALMFIPMWKWVVTPAFGIAVPGYWLVVGLLTMIGLLHINITFDDVFNSDGRDADKLVVYALTAGLTHVVVTGASFCVLGLIFANPF